MEIKPYEQGDEIEILRLFKSSFGVEMSLEYWEWRYKRNPHYNKLLIHLMWDGGILAGHYALSPVKLLKEGNEQLSGLSMTTMTHPDYRGMGIFTKLANSVYQEAFDVHLFSSVWGFPNSNSHYGFINKLGWEDISYIPMLSFKSDKKLEVKTHTINEIHDFSLIPNFNNLNTDRVTNHTSIYKNSDFLNWRFFDNPSNKYKAFSIAEEPGTYIVYKTYRRDNGTLELDIVDYFFKQDKVITQTYVEALRNQTNGNIASINTWAALNSNQHLWFERLGFQLNAPVTYFGFKRNPDTREEDLIFDDLTMCYSDVF